MKKQQSLILIVGIAIVLAGAAGFFGGMKYSEYQRTQGRANGFRGTQGGANNGRVQPRNGPNVQPISGEVISKDASTITVKTDDGGSKIVMVSATTIVSKTLDGTIADIAIGSKVGIFGTENSDKSMTAQTIQLNPQYRMGVGAGGNRPTPTK